ncbi:MAG: hypothetical protein GQ564_23175 [Bacteroidales bacterium]|nr:hypothetical protein [Bacteroidales bacterium]
MFIMKDFNSTAQKIIFFNCLIILNLFIGCNNNTSIENDLQNPVISHLEDKQNVEIAVSRPPFSDEYIFPCSECHADMEVNIEPRILEMHEEIVESYNHDSENRWCLACHDANTRDSLRLASGKLLDFKKSYKLCGQCHGDKLRDWKVGVHGKRSGDWNGKKQYLLCVHCHDPHSPHFKKLKPDPPPVKEEDIDSIE